MYSPKINEELIPILYRIAKTLKRPMTKLVNEMIAESLARYNVSAEPNSRYTRNASNGVPNVPCPVCRELRPLGNMRDVKVKIGKKKHPLAICDDCYEKHMRPRPQKYR